MSVARLTQKASRLLRKGRQWFFADDVEVGVGLHGGFVRVVDARGRDHGLGTWSETSKLALRLCGSWPEHGVPEPEEFVAVRLDRAFQARSWAGPNHGVRLVHGEADGLPGLVVDRYADVLVVQATSATMDAHLGAIVPALVERLAPRMVLARHDVAVRKLEGLDQDVRLLHGRRVESIEIEEAGVVHAVWPFVGHKTGFYLDQRPARAIVTARARDRRVLDLFAYQGAFALAALHGGATAAVCVDQSERALAAAAEAASRNGLGGLETLRANVFQALRTMRRDSHEPFDLVVVDPPAFAKSRRELSGALRGYRDLNRHALRLLAPGGVFVTCSCSHHVSAEAFEDVVRQAAVELPFRMFLRRRLGAGDDHPVRLALPESEYPKVLVLEREA